MRVLSALALAASAVVLAGSMAQAASMSGSYSGPATNHENLDLAAVGTIDWAFPWIDRSANNVATFSKVGGTAIGAINFGGTIKQQADNTGRDNFGSTKNWYRMNFGTVYDQSVVPDIQANSNGDFQSPWGINDPAAGQSFSSAVVYGRAHWEDANPATNANWTIQVAIPAGGAIVRMYIGNSEPWYGVTNAAGRADNGTGGWTYATLPGNLGYSFSASLTGASTYTNTDWFTEQRADGSNMMTAGEVGYMQFTATPDSAGDILTMTYSNVADGRRSVFVQGVTVSEVPEPTSLGLLALGGVALLRRRSR